MMGDAPAVRQRESLSLDSSRPSLFSVSCCAIYLLSLLGWASPSTIAAACSARLGDLSALCSLLCLNWLLVAGCWLLVL